MEIPLSSCCTEDYDGNSIVILLYRGLHCDPAGTGHYKGNSIVIVTNRYESLRMLKSHETCQMNTVCSTFNSIVILLHKRLQRNSIVIFLQRGLHCDPAGTGHYKGNSIVMVTNRYESLRMWKSHETCQMNTVCSTFNSIVIFMYKRLQKKFHCGLLAQTIAKEIPSQSSCTKSYIVILLCKGMHGDPAARMIAKITM